MEQPKVVYDWVGTRDAGDDATSNSGTDESSGVFIESGSEEQQPKGILKGLGPPKMPASNAYAPPATKSVTIADFVASSEEGGVSTTSTTTPSTRPVKRGRGRPKKGSAPTQAEGAMPLNDYQARQVENRLKDLDSKRAEKAAEERKKIIDEEMKKKEQHYSDEEMEVKALLDELEQFYTFWPSYRQSCSRKSGFNIHTPKQAIKEEIARIRADRKHNQAYNQIISYHKLLMFGIEKMGIEMLGEPIHGLAAEADKSLCVFEDTLKELSIDYKDYLVSSAEMRYAMGVVSMINTVRDRNIEKLTRGRSAHMNRQAQVAVEEKYSDL
jgi:hypothetical protein